MYRILFEAIQWTLWVLMPVCLLSALWLGRKKRAWVYNLGFGVFWCSVLFFPACIGCGFWLENRLTHEGNVQHAADWSPVFPGYEKYGPGHLYVPEDARDIHYAITPARVKVRCFADREAVLTWADLMGMDTVVDAPLTPRYFLYSFDPTLLPEDGEFLYFASESAPNGSQRRAVYAVEKGQLFFERNAW